MSLSTIALTASHTPSPLYHLPLRARHSRQDRISLSSVLSSSTDSSGSTGHLVSPVSPARDAFSGTYLSVPNVRLDSEEEEDDSDSWNVPTPKVGSFLSTPKPHVREEETKGWWGGNTPKLGPRRLAGPDYFAPLHDDGVRDDTSDICALDDSPTLGIDPRVPLDASPTLGAFDNSISTSRRASTALDDSPTLPPIDYSRAESPTLPTLSFPPARPLPSHVSYMRRAPTKTVDQMMSMDELLAGPTAPEVWSAKRLGKRPEMIRTQSEGINTDRSVSSSSIGMNISSTRPRSSSSTSTSSAYSIDLSTHSAPSIPTRSSSKRILAQPVISERSSSKRPPLPPSRASSLKGSSKPLPQFPSPSDVPVAGPAHPALVRTISSTRPRPPSPLSHPPVRGSLRRRSTTSSSFSSNLHTVVESPRDLDSTPDGSWALRPPPPCLHKAKSQPNLRTENAMNVPFKLRLKRSGSTHFFNAGDFSERRSFFGSLRKTDKSGMRSKLIDGARTSLDTEGTTGSSGSSGSSASYLSRPTSVSSTPAPRLDFASDLFATSPTDLVFPLTEEDMAQYSGDLAPPIDLIGEVVKDRIIIPPPPTKKAHFPPEDSPVEKKEEAFDFSFFEDAQLALLAMNEAEMWSWPDPPANAPSRSSSRSGARSVSPVPGLTSSVTASTLDGPLTPPTNVRSQSSTRGQGDLTTSTILLDVIGLNTPPSAPREEEIGLNVERKVRMGKGFTPTRELKTKYRRSIAPSWI